MCKHRFLFSSHSKICVSCGLENFVLNLDTWNKYSAPLCKGYERTVRFRQKTDKLLYLRNPPPFESPLWEHLKQQVLTCPQDVRDALRRFQGKNKHYDSVRLFTRGFTPFRVTLVHESIWLDKRLERLFGCVLRYWRMRNETPFFSYDFLLRLFLTICKSPLVVYCKPITCKKRHTRNLARLKLILTGGGDETSSQTLEVAHSRYARFLSDYPPYRRTWAWSALVEGVVVDAEHGHETPAAGPLPCLSDTPETG